MKRIKEFKPVENFNINNRKENHFYKETAVFVKAGNRIKPLIILRYYATQNMHYSCVWIHTSRNYPSASGTGNAGGYGYHRESAAASTALSMAGVIYNKYRDPGCVGSDAIDETLKDLAAKCGYRWSYIHNSHA